MITEIDLSNVRLFEGPTRWHFPLSPLTVFCGTNSAGKSTVLKCLSLLCQSHAAPEGDQRDGRLRLVGPFVDLGNFASFVSHNQTSRDVVIGISVMDLIENRRLRAIRRQKDVSSDPGDLVMQRYQDYFFTARYTFGLLSPPVGSAPVDSDLEAHGIAAVPPAGQAFLSAEQAFLKEANFEFKTTDDITLSWKIALTEQQSANGRPQHTYNMSIPVDYFGLSRGFAMMNAPKSDTHVEIETFMRGLLPIGLWAKQARTKRSKETNSTDEWSYFPLPAIIREASSNLGEEFKRIHYLGPLRSPAKRYYMTNLDSVPGMDASGDFLPYILRDRRDEQIAFQPPTIESGLRRGSLRHALDIWIHYIRTGNHSTRGDEDLHEIDVILLKHVLLEFTLRTFGGEAHALADSGFGYSQILPIVVRGLIAPRGSTIVIEQPELHLNPALQVRLAEFLASLTAAGKKVLVETHSEHIVNAIRVLSAEDPSDKLAQSCRIFFLDTRSGAPVIKRLDIQPDGTVPEWPRTFFGEALSLSARLLKAQERRRRDDVRE